MDDFTRKLYSVAQVRELEARAISGGIAGYALMQRAAASCWQEIQRRWPTVQSLHVVCGPGNNGGDGYELARLARAVGRRVRLLQVGAPPAAGDGALAVRAWTEAAGLAEPFQPAALADAALIVDALFGIGLTREVSAEARSAIEAINRAAAPVLAVDLPSGLDADTGAVRGVAVRAEVTVSFMARKLGLCTGAAADHVGEMVLDTLGIPAGLLRGQPAAARLLAAEDLRAALPRRARSAHKGLHGHVLVIGGDTGMMGAALLAARAALRSGAGLVSVATRPAHATAMTAAQPELMCHGVESAQGLRPLLERVDAVAIGPGLGQDSWGRQLLAAALETQMPVVADADALNLLASSVEALPAGWVLTPHPGEAARLLGWTTARVQAERPAAARALRGKYGAVAVLKGAGTLVQGEELAVCAEGNPGMGAGGMGDVLTGIIAALVAQGLSAEAAAQCAVLAHARAGDAAARRGERGLLPSDLLAELRLQLNP